MEEALLSRVRVRRDRLRAKLEFVQTECATGIDELSIKQYISELNELLDKLDCETKYYLKNSQDPDQTVANDCFEQQISAEDMIGALLKHLSKESTSASTSTTKLPKLELPKYDGAQTKWCEFWDKFHGNVDQKQIPDVDKLSYLMSCLEGAALQSVAGLPTTEGNYKIALDTLRRRFGSTTIQIDSHYLALNNLPKSQQSSGDCRATLDAIEHHLRILEQLGEPGNGNHLRALVLSKFPEQLIHQLHLIGNDDDTMITIRKNLDRIILAMERSAVLRPSNNSASENNTPSGLENNPSAATTGALHAAVHTSKPRRHKRKGDYHHERGQAKKRQSTHDNTPEPPKKRMGRACLFCDLRNHNSADCRRFQTIESRKDKLQGRCLKCLNKNHKTEECHKKVSCFRCNDDHLMMFCPKTANKELCEEWALAECEGEGWWREARDSSPGEVDVRYAGAAPVERAASAPATANAVRSALHSAKLINKKLPRVNLDISAKGIVVSDADTQENVISVSIYRISYCSADAANARVFAVVEGRPAGGSENHVVHVFVCTRRKHARALALSLAHAFNDAYQAWQANLNQGSSLGSDNKRLAPWVRFQEESDEEELDAEEWQSPAPLVTFA